ncbi:MAG: type II secretion system protein [Planctomycetota bacterium]
MSKSRSACGGIRRGGAKSAVADAAMKTIPPHQGGTVDANIPPYQGGTKGGYPTLSCSPVHLIYSLASKRPAFTLIELTVVIVIIAILAALVAWAGGRSMKEGQIRKTKVVMNNLVEAMEMYKVERGKYPDDPNRPGLDTPCPTYPHDPQPCPPTRYYSSSNNENPDGSLFYREVEKNLDGTDAYISPIEGFYYFLVDEPASNKILNKIPGELIKDVIIDQGPPVVVQRIRLRSSPLELGAFMNATRIYDTWGHEIIYGHDGNKNNAVPFFLSAGPDGRFGNDDDVYSFEAD